MAASTLRRRFGLVIRRHREALEVSQEDLAFEANVHRTYVSMLERGAANPSLDVIERLSKALGKSITSLFEEAERGRS